MQRRAPPEDADDLVRQYLRDRQATACPVAFCAPTTATVSAADAAVHRQRGLDPMGDIWRKAHPRHRSSRTKTKPPQPQELP